MSFFNLEFLSLLISNFTLYSFCSCFYGLISWNFFHFGPLSYLSLHILFTRTLGTFLVQSFNLSDKSIQDSILLFFGVITTVASSIDSCIHYFRFVRYNTALTKSLLTGFGYAPSRILYSHSRFAFKIDSFFLRNTCLFFFFF